MHKTVVLFALVSMFFNLSFSVIIPIANCRDSCICGCADEALEADAEAEIPHSSCCSPQKAAKVKKGCCEKEKGSHVAHFSSSKNNSRSMQFDLRSSVFDANILTEISGVDIEKYFTPVDKVYLIFKPPIA